MLRCVYHYRILFVVRGRKIFPLELPFPPSFFFLFLRSCPLPYLRRWRTNGSVNRSFAYRSIRSFLAIVQRKRYGFKSVNRLLLESCHTRFDASRFSRPRQFSSLFSFLLCFVFFLFSFFCSASNRDDCARTTTSSICRAFVEIARSKVYERSSQKAR